MVKIIRICAVAMLALLPIVGMADIAPMSFEDWRRYNRRAPRDDAAIESAKARLWASMPESGIDDVWFCSALAVALVFLVLLRPRTSGMRTKGIAWSVAGISLALVATAHDVDWDEGMISLMVFCLAVYHALALLVRCVRAFWRANRAEELRFCASHLVLLAVCAMAVIELGQKVARECEISWKAISSAPMAPPTDEDRKEYDRYLWADSHCTRCGTYLEYNQGRYCPKCHPERMPSRDEWRIR